MRHPREKQCIYLCSFIPACTRTEVSTKTKQTKTKVSKEESDNFKGLSAQCAASASIGMRRLRETRRIYRLRSCVSAAATDAAAADATDARRASKSVLRKRITHVISSRWVSTLQRVDFSGQKKKFSRTVCIF